MDGAIVRDDIAYQWKTGFGDAHQESIKGLGSHAPVPAARDGLDDEEIAPRIPARRASPHPARLDWVLHGEATLEDPVAHVPDHRADEFVARLWSTPHYGLLPAGHSPGWE